MSKSLVDWPPSPQENGNSWSEAKLTILKLLWPLEWVYGSTIFNNVKQTYYDRRIRELRESGWQIITSTDGKMYKLLSHTKQPGKERQYPNAKQKTLLRERDKVCKICGSSINLQYDHKVPLERRGTNENDNLQLLCSNCNVIKRGICKKCELEICDSCPYAFPEKFEGKFVIFTNEITRNKLLNESTRQHTSIGDLLNNIVSNYFDRRN